MSASLTSGTPAKLILRFALPLLIGNLFQQLYGMVNTLIVGRFLGVDALAAVGSTGGLMFLTVGFVQGMTAGFSIVTAQHYGAGDRAGVRRSFWASIVLGALSSAVLTILCLLFTRDLLELLSTPPEIIDAAFGYIRIILYGISSSVLFNLLSNSLLALGDSRPPLFFLIISCLLNIGLDLFFILVMDMGVRGAGWATLCAQFSAGLLCIFYIMTRVAALRPHARDLRVRAQELLRGARIGLPMGFQASIIAVGAIILQWALNTLGAEAVAAFAVARIIDMVAILPLASFGLAMATYVGQNYGAGNIPRIRQGVRHCCALSLSFSIAAAFLNIFGGRIIIPLFVGADQKVVTDLAQTFLNINGCMYWVLALLFVFRFTLQGLGQSLVPTLAGIMELCMRALAAILLTRYFGFNGAACASPLAWLGACIPLALAYFFTIRRLKA
ncbi:MAG: MATE family efflux transporter [Desulfovibrio sp.]|jgi:putative MATE family efflux protein|nr:MATE family efflux transporter [Desulfovibrio sp.]